MSPFSCLPRREASFLGWFRVWWGLWVRATWARLPRSGWKPGAGGDSRSLHGHSRGLCPLQACPVILGLVKKGKEKRQWRGLWGAGSAVADLHPGRRSGWVICSTDGADGAARLGCNYLLVVLYYGANDNLVGGANRVDMQTAHERESGKGGDTQTHKKGGAGVKNRAGDTQEKDRIFNGLCKRNSKFPPSSGQSGAEGFVLSVLWQVSIPEVARFGARADFYHMDKAAALKASKHLRVGHVMWRDSGGASEQRGPVGHQAAFRRAGGCQQQHAGGGVWLWHP